MLTLSLSLSLDIKSKTKINPEKIKTTVIINNKNHTMFDEALYN